MLFFAEAFAVYISDLPIVSPFAAVRLKYVCPSLAVFRINAGCAMSLISILSDLNTLLKQG